MTVTFDTSAYEDSHGKAPRGRGSWAFSPDRNGDKPDRIIWCNGTYADAKASARLKARVEGFDYLFVLP